MSAYSTTRDAQPNTPSQNSAKGPLNHFYLGLLIGAAYLIAEVWFNLRLLDVVSTPVDFDDLQRIERIGRTLSSIGFGLLVGRWIYRRKLKTCASEAAGAAIRAWVLGALFFALFQYLAIMLFSHTRSVDARLNAYQMLTIKDALASDRLSIVGLEFINDELDSPQSKTLIALLAPLLYATPQTSHFRTQHRQRLEGIARQVHSAQVSPLYDHYMELSNSRQGLLRLYREIARPPYREAYTQMEAAYASILADYNRRFGRHGIARGSRQGMPYYSALDDRLRREAGVSIPGRPWIVPEKDVFMQHTVSQLVPTGRVRGAFAQAVHQASGLLFVESRDGFSMGQFAIDWSDEQFLASDYLNRNLSAPLMGSDAAIMLGELTQARMNRMNIPWGLSFQAFHDRTLENILTNMRKEYEAQKVTLERQRDQLFFSAGSEYVEALWIPAIALTLSLIMALLNLISLLTSIMRFPFERLDRFGSAQAGRVLSHGLMVVSLSIVIITPYVITTSEFKPQSSSAYQSLISNVREVHPVPAWVLDWTVRAQPLLDHLVRPLLPASKDDGVM